MGTAHLSTLLARQTDPPEMGFYGFLRELPVVDGTLKILASTEPQPEGPCQEEDGSNEEEQKNERKDTDKHEAP